MRHTDAVDVIVVGGGLAGLTAAAVAARAGRRVRVFERAPGLGGRAATHVEAGFSFNLGPHALYRGGPGLGVLRELGLEPKGSPPPVNGYVLRGGKLHTLPGGFFSLLVSGLLPLGGKLEVARLLARATKIDTAELMGVTVADWLARLTHAESRDWLAGLLRVSTYANAPAVQSAGVAVEQLKQAFTHGVLYLDGGWRTLIEGLHAVAVAAGAEVAHGTGVAAVVASDGAVRGVRLSSGEVVRAGAVVLAGTPAMAQGLLAEVAEAGRTRAAVLAASAVQARAACLDLGLKALPRPKSRFVLGADQPLYLSVHSGIAAGLAPEGGATVHVARYLAPEDVGADAEPELEALMDLAQPGWREQVVARRFLPSMLVAGGIESARAGGFAGRPPVQAVDVAGLLLAGDWVGADGHLAGASLASGRAAGQAAAQLVAGRLAGAGAGAAAGAGAGAAGVAGTAGGAAGVAGGAAGVAAAPC